MDENSNWWCCKADYPDHESGCCNARSEGTRPCLEPGCDRPATHGRICAQHAHENDDVPDLLEPESKPCPFCGKQPQIESFLQAGESPEWWAACWSHDEKHMIELGPYGTAGDAAQAWDERLDHECSRNTTLMCERDELLRDGKALKIERLQAELKLAREEGGWCDEHKRIYEQSIEQINQIAALTEELERLKQYTSPNMNANFLSLEKTIDNLRTQLATLTRERDEYHHAHEEECALGLKRLQELDDLRKGQKADNKTEALVQAMKTIRELQAKLAATEDEAKQYKREIERLQHIVDGQDEVIERLHTECGR
jgi:hypothetical protein